MPLEAGRVVADWQSEVGWPLPPGRARASVLPESNGICEDQILEAPYRSRGRGGPALYRDFPEDLSSG